MPIALLTLLSLALFVSAAYYSDKNQGALIISKGWNLVPYVSEQLDDTSTLQLKDAKYIYAYDINKQQYELIYTNGDIWRIDETTPWKLHSSVWAYFEEEGIMTLDFDEYQLDTFALNNENLPWNLKGGWNFIFVVPDMAVGIIGNPSTARSLNDIKGDCAYEKIYSYKQNEGGWINLMNNLDDKRMLGENSAQMYGLVVKVSGDCTLGYTGDALPPSIPN